MRSADLIDDLLRPESYPGPRPRAVSLRATHISWVFLTDDAAWKVKRPVNLGFVDFRTLESRRYFCAEELRLNARLAPSVYQAVVPVRRGKDGHTFADGPGEIVEYAVKMRRLPDEQSASARLAAGHLACAHLEALAEHLAAFYAAAPAPAAFDPLRVMTDNVEENFTQLATFAGAPLDDARLAAVAAAQRKDLQRLASALESRSTVGKIREGHGDLRLEHVYFPPDGGPLVIDCVEFAERFRTGDIALDVAFLAMELAAGGNEAAAEYFLYRFARATADFDLYPVVDFFLCYRAVVRTKIACILAADPNTPADKARSKAAEANRLLAFAHALGRGAAPPRTVIAIGGLVGAGKSTVAEAIARRLGLPVVSSDLTRKQLAGLPSTARGDARLYTEAFTQRTYDEVFRRAALVLSSGRSVVLDATFRTPKDRQRARRLAAEQGARSLFIEATCDEATLRRRLRERAQGPAESDADERVLDRLLDSFVPPTEMDPAELLTWRSDQSESALIAALADRCPGPWSQVR
jgi:aminoglycoside phosphotransferase family enzyme/predicted kinase